MPEKGDEGVEVLVDLAAAMDPNAGPVAGDTRSRSRRRFGWSRSDPAVRHRRSR